jgi:hypothetical protein
LLKFESNLVCAPCHHGKMIAASRSLVKTVMTEQPGSLLRTNTVDPSWVHSMGGRWYVLVRVNYPGTVGHRLRPKTPGYDQFPIAAYGWRTIHRVPGGDPTSTR